MGDDTLGDDKRGRRQAWATRRQARVGDPRGRPSRIQHGFPYFVRGRRPPPSWRPVPTQTRPSGNRHPAWATTSVAPTRTTRRRGPRRGDPRGRPSRIQHGFPYFVRGRRSTSSWRPVPTQTRPSGNRHGRRQASPLREQLGDEARVGATLAVAHPESNTASLTSHEVGVPRPRGVPCRPKRGRREPASGMGDDKRRPYANNSATRPA